MRVCVCYFLDQKLGGSISLHLRSLIKDTTVTCHAKNNAGKAQEVLEILVRYAPDRYHASISIELCKFIRFKDRELHQMKLLLWHSLIKC